MNEQDRIFTRASSARYDRLCPGRHQAQIGILEKPNPDADFGNQIHKAWATGVDEGLDARQLSILESTREIELKLIQQVFGQDGEKVKTFKEQRHFVMVPTQRDGKVLNFEHAGHPDVIHRLGSVGLVLDLKSLAGEQQDIASHEQLRDYSVMAARKHLIGEIYAAVIQPLVTHTPQLVKYTQDDIAKSEQEMFARVIASNTPGAKRIAGEDQCKFCRAKPVCKEHAAWNATNLPTPVSIFDKPVAMWSEQDCVAFLDRKDIAAKWLAECTQQMKERLAKAPDSIPGWELVPGDKRKTITDLNELHGRFVNAGGKSSDFLGCMKLTMEKFEMALRGATKLKGKALLAKLTEMFDGIVEEKQNAPSLGRKK